MNAADVFLRVVGLLEVAQIPYMVTGSFASSFHGTPRTTQDIDLIVFPTVGQLRGFLQSLPASDYYVSGPEALEALERQGQFNVIDLKGGWKIDFIIGKNRPFSREEFARRAVVNFMGMSLTMASVEDTILAKLEWSKLGESTRQLEDVAAMLRIRHDEIDTEYLTRWIEALGLDEVWSRARRLADSAT